MPIPPFRLSRVNCSDSGPNAYISQEAICPMFYSHNPSYFLWLRWPVFSSLHYHPAAAVINGVLTTQKFRFQGEAAGSHSFVVWFTGMPYVMGRLATSMGGFAGAPGRGRIRHIPTLRSPPTLSSGIRQLKLLLDCKGRFFTSPGAHACLLATQQVMVRKWWRCGRSRKPVLIPSAPSPEVLQH